MRKFSTYNGLFSGSHPRAVASHANMSNRSSTATVPQDSDIASTPSTPLPPALSNKANKYLLTLAEHDAIIRELTNPSR